MNFKESFLAKLESVQESQKTLLCVGLDPDLEKIPDFIERSSEGVFEFLTKIIDTTHDLVCAYKPQIAHFSALGMEAVLEKVIKYIRAKNPQIQIILDSKRSDIGSTADKYAQEAFFRYTADAVTVNPYLGSDCINAFSKFPHKGVIILCRTSNASAGEIQDLESAGKKVFEHIADKALSDWNRNKNIALVIGATYPQELSRIRKTNPSATFLVPGIGAQGGDLNEILKLGLRNDNKGLIISSSRAVIYASKSLDYADRARDSASKIVEIYRSYSTRS